MKYMMCNPHNSPIPDPIPREPTVIQTRSGTWVWRKRPKQGTRTIRDGAPYLTGSREELIHLILELLRHEPNQNHNQTVNEEEGNLQDDASEGQEQVYQDSVAWRGITALLVFLTLLVFILSAPVLHSEKNLHNVLAMHAAAHR